MLKKLQFGGDEEGKHLFNYKIIQQFCFTILNETFSIGEARGIGYYYTVLLPTMCFESQLKFVNGIKKAKIDAKFL